MKEAPQVTNVVEACSKESRQIVLDALLEQLELCEKALQVYVQYILLLLEDSQHSKSFERNFKDAQAQAT